MANSIVRGALWMVTLRWSIRGIGLISIVILARILTPADFGVVAMGSLVTGLLAVFSDMGTWQLLIRIKNPLRIHYDTAWTIGLIQAFLLAGMLFFSAPLAASYFDDTRVIEVIRWLSLGSIIGGFKNIGIINFRKELQFDKDFKFELFLKLSAFVITVSLAFYLKTYWALVFGVIGGAIVGVAWSYVMHPYRPRFSVAKWREFVSFSFWVTPSGVADFLNRKADTFVVGFIGGTAQLGVYNVASELSSMATNEVVLPIGRALFPSYANLKDDPEQLLLAFVNVLRVVAIVCCSFGVGLALVAEDFVYLVLGDQWGSAVPLVRWLAIFGALDGLCQVMNKHIFIVMGRERLMFALMLLRLLLFTAGVLVAGLVWREIGAVAIAATLTTACYVVVLSFCLQLVVEVSPLQVGAALIRPLLSSGVMVLTLSNVDLAPISGHAVSLIVDALLGATVFMTSLVAFWLLSGRPPGPEKASMQFLGRVLCSKAVVRNRG